MDQSQDFESVSDAFPVRLEHFDGPLDLLLHLIKKNEVNIYDIPIALITQQYLDALRLMEELDLDVAGEFIVMAATLIHVKSKMLLPRPETAAGVDEPEPRPDPQRQPSREADRGGDVLDERRRIEDVRRAEGVDAQEVEVGRRDGMPRCRREVRAVHPELARAIVTDQPDAFEPGALVDRSPKEDGLDPAGLAGDGLEARQLAR